MNKLKKLLSVTLAVVMVMSVMPVGMVGAAGDISLQSSADDIIVLFEEDFEEGYTVGDNWVKDENKVTITGGDSVNYSYGNWDFQSNLNGQTENTGDSISVEDVSSLGLGGGFDGNALRLYNNRANAYNKNYLAYRRNFDAPINLNSGEYAGKKLVVDVDVIIKKLGTSYSADKQASFPVPSRQTKIYEYGAKQWKPALRGTYNFRIEQGGYATKSHGMNFMWYRQPISSAVLNSATNLKVVVDQTGEVDSMSAWVNGTLLNTPAYPTVFEGHPLNGKEIPEIFPSNFEGQAFNFSDAIRGIWGNVSDMEIYVDNFKAYLVDEFEVESINVKATGFDPATDKVEFTFTNEVDETTVSKDCFALLDEDGEEITNGIVSVALKSDDAKTIEVEVTEAVLGETSYKVALKDGLNDIYGSSYEREYVWYEYPNKAASGTYTYAGSSYPYTYTAKTATEPAKVTAGGKTAAIDCYVPQMKTEGTVAEFETCRLLEYENATPPNESITAYVQGEDQEITLYFNDVLASTVDIANAFEVTDETGAAVEGLVAAFGDTNDVVVLQLSGLILGEGKHTIKSKENALYNASNKYANISYVFDTLDFTASPSETAFDYMPTTEKEVTVELSLPTVLDATTIASGFEVKNDRGEDVTGVGIALDTTGKVITFSFADADVEKGTIVIKPTAALTDARGRVAADFEIVADIVEFSATASESSGFQHKPGTEKTITIELSLPTVLDAANIASGFEVETQAGAKVNGLGVTLSGDKKTVTLDLSDLVVENGKYFIKSTDALTDEIGRKAEINLMFNVAKEVILFEEDFEFGYTLNENWINNDNKVSAGKYSVANGAWDIQSTSTTDSMSVVDASGLGLGGNITGNALRLYNDAATSYSAGHFSFRRNFNGTTGISLTSGEYAGKKLIYEADIYVKNAAGKYSADHQSSFLGVSKNQGTIHDYGNGQWKPTIQTTGVFRVEEGTYASSSYGPLLMWYGTPMSTHRYSDEAAQLKIILDQTGVVDTISVYANGQLLTSTRPASLNGHKMSGLESSALLPSGYQGQEFNFADTVYGIWGSPSDMEIYVDNFKAYLIDSFSIESVEIDGSETAFEASTDSIVYTFTGEVDPSTIKDAIAVYDAEGNKLGTAIKSAVLEGGNKVLRITLAKSLAGESEYKVVLNDSIKDIYGAGIANDYEWYEYPINDYYTADEDGFYSVNSILLAYTPASGSAGAKMSLADGTRTTFVDCYVPVPSRANREVEFTTSRKIVVENVSPAVITGYDLGRDQTVTITLAEEISASTNLNNAFTVTDEDGKNIEGLAASFGETTDTIILQLSGLMLGDGKHLIESVDGALANADGIFANVSISVSTVDFMVTYAEPGSEVIAEYKQGDNQVIALGLSSPAAITSTDVSSAFDVYDEDGNVVTGIKATYNTNDAAKTNDDTISLQLSGLSLGRGKHTIKTNSNLKDRRGRALEYEYVFTKLPFKADYSANITGYEPKSDAKIDIVLSYELNDASINAIDNAFIVENEENLRVSGLKASVSADKKVISLQLKDLDITGGSYKITSKTGALVSATGEELSPIMIIVDTVSDEAFGPSTGEGAGSGAPLAPGTDFSTVVLLDENFENSTEKAEKGIEFIPAVNWYTSPEKIPSGFGVVKTGAEYRDAKIAVVPDPADPASGNMVLMYDTGVYGKDGSKLGTPVSTSSGINFTTLTRELDSAAAITKDQYTEVRMSSKIYVPSTSIANLPLSSQQLRNSQYVFAAKSATNTPLTSTNFAKDLNTGNPKFHTYQSSKASTSNGKTGGFDGVFTTNEWHTMEYVFSVHEFVEDGGAMKGAFHVYIDGKLVSESAFLANDYNALTGMVVRLVQSDAGGSIVVYYDDWKISQSTKFRTHVDTAATNVPEDQKITLTLTKALDAESVKLIEDSLASETLEDMISVVDENGNKVNADITITDGNVIKISPTDGLKYSTQYLVEIKSSTKVNGVTHMLKAEDGEAYSGLSYPFETAKAKDTYIDAEASSASFNCFSPDMETATRFAYTMNLSGVHATDVIAAVAVYTEKDELIGIDYQVIPAGSTQANFDFTTFSGRTGGKVTRMYIWEAKPDGSKGRLMHNPDEITSR